MSSLAPPVAAADRRVLAMSGVGWVLACLALTLCGCADLLGYGDIDFDTSGSGGVPGTGGAGGVAGAGGTAGAGGANAACATDADCAGSPYGDRCDLPEGKCVECLPAPADNDCAFGLYCDAPTKSCAVGCAVDADCNVAGSGALVCDVSTHQCTSCSAAAACPPGSKCEGATGVCVPGCEASAECPDSDWACCLKKCKNVTKDLQNCGACEEPCLPDQSTTWLCLAGACVYQSCMNGWADCDQNIGEGNGCEVDTVSDPQHCGACGEACELANATEGCARSTCTIEGCAEGFGDCDGKVSTGCEADLLTDPENCSACGEDCPALDHGVPGCAGGACFLAGCEAGFGDCDDNDDNGCETSTIASVQHCGACDAKCALPNAASACEDSQCAIALCDEGFLDCNQFADDGCESLVASDVLHCGACDNPCTFPNAEASCSGGACVMGACKPGFADCDGQIADGCETDVGADEASCGACGAVCAAMNGLATCVAGECQIQCAAGFEDCDGLGANGCEANTTNSVAHCGDCQTQCPSSGGTPYCFQSDCGLSSCAPGTANCDGNPANGCEASLDSVASCGSCGTTCSANHGTPSCNGATCAIACSSGFGDCNGNVGDGCEQPLTTNDHCTACGVPCSRPHAFTSCGTGACQIVSCEAGWADCNLNASDGCEAQIATDEANCGGCGVACAPANALGSCTLGACSIQSCTSGFEDCNGGVQDGCEVSTSTSLGDCGGCGITCSLPNAAAACQSGTCQIASCNGTFANCDGSTANGCEANLQSAVAHCGGCGNACSSQNGAPTCAAGQCNILCNAGFASCDGDAADGCETSLKTLTSCGACNTPCNLSHAAESCATGTCQIVGCEAGFSNCDNVPANGCECGASCMAGVCQGCGDGLCQVQAGEGCASCPVDCGACCGNGTCEAAFGETCSNCSVDCGSCPATCGNGACEPPGETCATCPSDCGPCCGNGSCQGGVGENCTTCPLDCGSCCGNGVCEASKNETCMNCQADCSPCVAPVCGDTICDFAESCMTCPDDCGMCSGSSSSSSSSSGAGGDAGPGSGGAPPI